MTATTAEIIEELRRAANSDDYVIDGDMALYAADLLEDRCSATVGEAQPHEAPEIAYHVFYHHDQGYGSIEIKSTTPIGHSLDRIRQIEEALEADGHVSGVSVSHWNVLENATPGGQGWAAYYESKQS